MDDIKCMHCGVKYSHDFSGYRDIILFKYSLEPLKDIDGAWAIRYTSCPVCKKNTIFLLNVELEGPIRGGTRSTRKDIYYRIKQSLREILIYPLGRSRSINLEDVPIHIAQDYKEACLVLLLSPKASAALSRRCLQNLLRDAAKVAPSDLSKEIQEAIDSDKLPSHLAKSIDAIRNIGNFAAHPMKSKNSGEIVDIEIEEAEWNLDVLESLFDFYYVQPTVIAKKREALNSKLQEAGKPPMK